MFYYLFIRVDDDKVSSFCYYFGDEVNCIVRILKFFLDIPSLIANISF